MSFFSKLIGGNKEQSAGNASSHVHTQKEQKHKPSADIAFLDEVIRATADDGTEPGVTDLISLSLDQFNNGNIPNCVRCLNTALDLEHSITEEIAIRRNMTVALASFLGLGTSQVRQRDFDFCFLMENLNKNMDAIIGLYATNEPQILSGDNAEFLRNCFDMALSNYQSVMIGYMAYEQGGKHHIYEHQLPKIWNISFVAEPKGALQVNGTIYPQHLLKS